MQPEDSTKKPDEDTTPFDDDKTSRAIDEIVAKEGDTVLAAEDEQKAGELLAKPPRARGGWFSVLLHSKVFWWAVVLLLCGGVAAIAAIPTGRYWALNTAGVRSAASVVTVDDVTGLPVTGVTFRIGGAAADTDAMGKATLTGLRLGPTTLTIEQAGYAQLTKPVIVGWGSNPLGTFKLKAAGVSYTIEVKDYLSGKPVAGVQAASGEATAVSNKQGKIILPLPGVATADDTVVLSKDGYRSDEIALQPDPKQVTNALLVVHKKTVYVSKQSGTYDVWKSDIDGKNAQVLLKGTGSETSNISVAMSPDGTRAAVVSTRDNKRNAEGLLLSSLLVVNIHDGEAMVVSRAAQVQLIDWIGTRLVFEQISPDAATSPASRYTVVSYDIHDATRVQLAAAKRLNVVFSAQSAIYYAVAADSADASVKPAFYKIYPDGTGKQMVLETEIWGGQRVAYDTLHLQTAHQTWIAFDLTNGRGTEISGPSSFVNRLYADNPARSKSIWVETKDGQGALQLHTVGSARQTTLVSQGGLTYPVHWLTDTVVVYRVVLGGEVADYAASTEGGPAHKIADVVTTYGFTSGQ